MSKAVLLLIFGLLLAIGASVYGLRAESVANSTVANLQRSNDSLTRALSSTVKHVDSLQNLAARELAVAASYAALAAAASGKIVVVERRRDSIPRYIKQLPDTGVARRFKELLR